MNPDHLLDQADRLTQPSAAGAPRQADLRRAISSAYYALFHYILKSAADMSVGAAMRKTNPDLYGRAYRSLEHADVVTRSKEARAIGANIKAFADAVVDLQKTRVGADYDPTFRITRSDATTKVSTVRAAIARFEAATEAERKAYLATILFKKR